MEENHKACPYCAEPIREAATVCRYCNRSLTKRPLRLRAVILLVAAVLLLLGIFIGTGLPHLFVKHESQSVESSSSPSQGSAAANLPEPSPPPPPPPSPPPPVPVAKFFPIVNGNVVVPPQRIQYFKFDVPEVAQDAKVNGSFHAFGGSGNDIEVAIMTPFEFENWSNGHGAHVYYESGKVTNGQIEVDGILPGTYIIGFSNRFSLTSRKEVTAQITLSYTVLEQQ